MNRAERLQQWLNAHGFKGSLTFNLAFFALQVIFYVVIVIALVIHFGT